MERIRQADNLVAQDTDEVMIPLFAEDTDGKQKKSKVRCHAHVPETFTHLVL